MFRHPRKMNRQPEADAFIRLMDSGEYFTTREFAKATEIHPNQVFKLLTNAAERGLIERKSKAAPIWKKI